MQTIVAIPGARRLIALFATFALTGIAASVALPAEAAQPVIGVQGVLRSADGQPVPDGPYTLTFRLYASLAAEKSAWKEVHIDTPVVQGGFALELGTIDDENPMPAGLFASEAEAAIGVQVSLDPELPRHRLHAVPYALHALTAATLAGGLTGDKIAAGSVPASALGFDYATSDKKGGDALGLTCTGCVGIDDLAADVLDAKNVAFVNGGVPATVQQALASLVTALKTDGVQVGIGKSPGNICALDVGTDGGDACIDGAPALWTRFASSDEEMSKLGKDGQIVYRKDKKTAWMQVGGKWRQIAFLTVCGDGVVEADEACDDGDANADAPDKCRTNCALPACGDTIVDGGEGCDDGNLVGTDACTNACKVATCGDGSVQAGVEQCDDGNLVATDACTSACEPAACGDSFVQAGVEQCDDGNLVATDACTSACKVATCGDGFVQAGVEACDDGPANADAPDKCRKSCKLPICGDGIKDAAESCDDGNQNDSDACSNACTQSNPPQIPGFQGDVGPVLDGWSQCAGTTNSSSKANSLFAPCNGYKEIRFSCSTSGNPVAAFTSDALPLAGKNLTDGVCDAWPGKGALSVYGNDHILSLDKSGPGCGNYNVAFDMYVDFVSPQWGCAQVNNTHGKGGHVWVYVRN